MNLGPLKTPLNLYKFSVNGKKLIYDVNTRHVFGVNSVAWDILDAMDRPNSGEMLETVIHRYNSTAVDEFLGELNELRAKGLLSSSDYERYEAPVHQPITFLRLHVSHTCNLRCKYCFANNEPDSKEHVLMDEITTRKAIDFLIRQSGGERFLTVQFFGGEPLLNFSVVRRTVEYAKVQGQLYNKEFKFYVFTNCFLLTEEIQNFLRENNADIAISLDGSKEVHNDHRPTRNNKDSYEKVKSNALRLLKTANQSNLFVRGTFTGRNYDIAAMVKHLVEFGFRNVSVQPCMLPKEHDYAVKLEDLSKVAEAYNEVAKAYLASLLGGRLFYFYPLFNVMKKLHSPSPSLFPCDAGRSSLAVSPTGEIFPCHELLGFEEYKLGNVFRASIDGSVERLFHFAHVQNKEKCCDCWARYLCGGGCHAHAIKYSGDIRDPYEVECELTQHRIRLGMWIYSVLASEHPEILKTLLNHDENACIDSTLIGSEEGCH